MGFNSKFKGLSSTFSYLNDVTSHSKLRHVVGSETQVIVWILEKQIQQSIWTTTPPNQTTSYTHDIITKIGLHVRHVGISTDAKKTGAAPDFTSVGFGISDSHFFFRFYKCTGILTLRLLMSYIYIYGAPILDVSRSHTTTHHSR